MAVAMSAPPTATGQANVTNPTDTTQQNITGYGQAETSDTSAVKYIVAWTIVFLILALLNRSRVGHAIIYYLLALALLVLLVVNYQAITALIAPASGTSAEAGPVDTVGPSQEASGPMAGNQPAGITETINLVLPQTAIISGVGAPRVTFSG